MPEVLEDAGVSWKCYNPPGPLYSIDTMRKVGLHHRQRAALLLPVREPDLPAVPEGLPARPSPATSRPTSGRDTCRRSAGCSRPVGYDEHPPAPSFLGEWFTDQVLATLVSNPDVWSKTVLFHMYDENDGFFDHVAPPVARPARQGST